jgi:hypothetical protein
MMTPVPPPQIDDFVKENFDGKYTTHNINHRQLLADVSGVVSKKPNNGNFIKMCKMFIAAGFLVCINQPNKKAVQMLREKGFTVVNPECLGTQRQLLFTYER